jgi:hypothetical protein
MTHHLRHSNLLPLMFPQTPPKKLTSNNDSAVSCRQTKASLFISKWITLPEIINNLINQHNETNVMHLSLNLLRIKGMILFRALLAYPQETLHKRTLVYCVRIMSDGCGTVAVKLPLILNKLNEKRITSVSLY